MSCRCALRADKEGDLAGRVGMKDGDGAAAGDHSDEVLAAGPGDGGEAQTGGAAARRGEWAGDLRRVKTVHGGGGGVAVTGQAGRRRADLNGEEEHGCGK